MARVAGPDYKRATCFSCNTMNEYASSEVRVINRSGSMIQYGFTCANCNRPVNTTGWFSSPVQRASDDNWGRYREKDREQ